MTTLTKLTKLVWLTSQNATPPIDKTNMELLPTHDDNVGNNNNLLHYSIEDSSKNIYVVGKVTPNNSSGLEYHATLFKLDSNGETLWDRIIGHVYFAPTDDVI